ncbi:hypothetical protein SAMN05444355_104240 [Flavobacterium frigoris]|uniref:Uncharacterized protein n=1 Tax=Flavobacterium frigoris TaxID=229204 RepID=A0A1H9J8B9_FLAFI|nr:hypothetical protein SAMN05444355_104240 [Flavobacterium frigoris]
MIKPIFSGLIKYKLKLNLLLFTINNTKNLTIID